MRWSLPSLLFTLACTGPSVQPEPTPDKPTLQELMPGVSFGHPVINDATSLLDFVPETLDGMVAAERVMDGETAKGTYTATGRRVTVSLAPIRDIAASRDSFELLGKDTVGRVDGREIKGLRMQGNPAQASITLDPPFVATLNVVAANAFLVTVQLQPAESREQVQALGDRLAISSLTRFAIARTKAAPTTPSAEKHP